MKISALTLALGLTVTATTAFAGESNTWEDSARDAWIDGKAETTLLLNTNLNSFDINTDVENGTVILTGKVDNRVNKALAEELVLSLDGVKDVDNQLTVMSDLKKDKSLTDELSDAKVATVVKTRLLMQSEVSGTDIDVDVENGIVTLKGTVASSAEQDLALSIARNTSDVKKVVDLIEIVAES